MIVLLALSVPVVVGHGPVQEGRRSRRVRVDLLEHGQLD